MQNCYETYDSWEDRDRDRVATALRHSGEHIYALDTQVDEVVASARVLTDYSYYGVIYDVIVNKAYRDEGLGKRVVRSVVQHPPLTDVELLALLSDAAAVDYSVTLGPVGRVLEFPTAVERLDYRSIDATLTVSIVDDIAEWNDDTYEITVSDGNATVTRTDTRPDIQLDIGTFTQLFVGYGGVERARLTGTFEVYTDGVVETLSSMYPQRTLFCPDRF
ncbi:GNAT family N-acetyltransferase [Haloarcula salinisoli]|uniref:GNAT family N-acetyltransferase n=1 Tax=Haloarcula salinisoli TaxID=2487746 RepID=A0A8J7YNL5_9EURY|nr:GNAT family N-acetyltransferase [Halomicroarcula salinisoli]MBX0288658.1 GNAT family N-acetyltransferase [Halomicroarcula salinisoli]MBX0306049.1 GNAT family N-acetyltransferase [Halomicroarcula salinisoli]